MTTCYQLLRGPLPELPRTARDLAGRLETTVWPPLPEGGRHFAVDGAGYLHLQSRRPDSPAFALAALPAGLLAARENTLVAWYEHGTGGHVAALDAPTEFVADLTDLIHRTGALR
ncbi:hypothetical protein [Virgisporangium aurantiacum]|uniref:Uncharacterized protein n=1 Tax=Virgisporangium aurantiacum TaxID=175570 RepID=A0A8J3ZCB7_9ACTN|nr:hypothetical protein [Virgisporangium aurantiacum]GIJ61292.1 hypothetical protein Vau01_088080 [Virgisporangium aurantiacum]